MKVALWLMVFMIVCVLIAIVELKIITKSSNGKQKTNKTPNNPSKIKAKDEEYMKYIMSNCPRVKREDVVSFLSVVDVYERTGDKQKTLEAFDAFIMPIVKSDLMYASMVSGFFCGLLGNNISLSDSEVNLLSEKYSGIIKQQIIERGGIFN